MEGMARVHEFYPDLKKIQALLYEPNGFEISQFRRNAESTDYSACVFELNGLKVVYRTSKITPAKTGQFVTIWKRNDEGITEPFGATDDLDFVIITCLSGDKAGQFIFPKSVLAAKNILRKNGKGGKRGIRVYPTWDAPTSKQAISTQLWQAPYFVEITDGNVYDRALLTHCLKTV